MTLFARLFIFIALIISQLQGISGDYQSVGPILVSAPVSPYLLAFYDIGADAAWEIPTENAYPLSWSPDGCYLLTTYGYNAYRLFNLPDRAFEEVVIGESIYSEDLSLTYSTPYFSDDGQFLVYAVSSRVNPLETPTIVYLVDTQTQQIEYTYEIPPTAFLIGWTSSRVNYIVYSVAGNRLSYDLDLQTGESRLNDERVAVSVSTHDEWWYSYLYQEVPSPDETIHALFYDRSSFGFWVNSDEEDDPNALNEDQVAELIDVPADSGFDLYFVQTDEWRGVDFFGKFVEQIVWSPDNTRLAVSSAPLRPRIADNRIYIYDVVRDSFQQLGDYSPAYDTEYGLFHFAWSADGRWLAFADASEGWFAYRIDDDFVVPLSDYFTGFMTRVYWSPNIDYSISPCNTD